MKSEDSGVAATAKIYPNVQLGAGATIGEFVIIGEPPGASRPGELPTVIGPGAKIRSHTVIYAGNKIGKNFMTGHGALVRESNDIGDDVSIGSHTIVEHHVTLGDRVRIHSNAFIPEFTRIDEDAWLGPHVVVTNATYPLGRDAKANLKGPHIKKGAKVGANVTLLPGVELGERCLVGAGAVVARSVPAAAVVVGNPAHAINTVDKLPY